MPKKSVSKMDARCPRQLDTVPESWCPLAVLRLKAIRNAGRELTEEEEEKLPGCSWAVDHQLANYCFFNYVADFASEKTPSDMEVASLLNVSVETIKKIEKVALEKMKNSPEFEGFSCRDLIKDNKEQCIIDFGQATRSDLWLTGDQNPTLSEQSRTGRSITGVTT